MEIEVSEKEKRRSDPYIWGIIIILYIVSVVEVYSAISREITGGGVFSHHQTYHASFLRLCHYLCHVPDTL